MLRLRTAGCHVAVDAAYADFDLAQADDYAAFLGAHARALLPVEDALGGVPGLPAWRPRAPLLRADLAALGVALPPPLTAPVPADAAAALGMLYVLEGSRLGGAMLARRVPAGLPSAYLGAAHLPGEWRALRSAIDTHGAGREDAVLAGAEAAFALFECAARPNAAA